MWGMKLYTKSGDGGFASLPGAGGKARKDDPRFSAVGSLDELNAAIGFCLVEAGRAGDASVVDALEPVQAELFSVGAVPPASLDEAVARIEKRIDAICGELPELKDFILPGGCELACRLHLARTIARRAERAVVAALNLRNDEPFDKAHDGPHEASGALRYLNRLSDLLFALARQANHDTEKTMPR